MSDDFHVTRLISAVGFAILTFLGGAASAYFQWFPYQQGLVPAFEAGEAYAEKWFGSDDAKRRSSPGRTGSTQKLARTGDDSGVTVLDRDEATPGYTLFTVHGVPEARLIDLDGEVVHRWHIEFSDVWPDPPHIDNPVSDADIHWRRAAVFGDGGLLASYTTDADTPYGYGLVKLDRDSEVVWRHAARTHHDFDVARNGSIVALEQTIRPGSRVFPTRPQYYNQSLLVDRIVTLTPHGKPTSRVSLAEAINNSNFAAALDRYPATIDAIEERRWDPFHTNNVDIIRQSFAKHHDFAEPGQILISIRANELVGLLDRSRPTITWATRGFWRMQHDPDTKKNGNIVVFDNAGHRGPGGQSRLLEFDPATNEIVWSYHGSADRPFATNESGSQQLLPDDHILVTSTEQKRIFELTRDGEIVWEYREPPNESGERRSVYSATRYPASQLPFLN